MSDITTQVKNYTGHNTFILKMKESLKKYNALTPNQKVAVEKIFKNVAEAKKVELTDNQKKIMSYEGQNSFVNEIKSKLKEFGKISEKQESAALAQIQKKKQRQNKKYLNYLQKIQFA